MKKELDMAKNKATGTSIVNIEAELAKEAEGISKRIQAPSGDYIKVTQDKFFQMPDGSKHQGPLSVVILDFVAANLFYDQPFKEGQNTPPACVAIGLEPLLLIPDEASPVKQAEACSDCPNNDFGSKGAGKACTNTRILAVVEPNADENAPILLLKVSPTGIKPFDSYVASIKSQFNTVPAGVVTDIYFDPNLKYGSLRFGNPRVNENLAVHYDRRKAAKERLLVIPDLSGYTPPPKVKGKK